MALPVARLSPHTTQALATGPVSGTILNAKLRYFKKPAKGLYNYPCRQKCSIWYSITLTVFS
jgi:hypothetical protein